MDKYEYLGVLGQGSYGKVMKCRHKESGQLVAIKKFIETEEDLIARKMALREIRMLKKLKHDNLVNMLEVFRRKKRFHLVFEFMAQTLLDKFENLGGLSEELTRVYTYQILRALDFCHSNNIVHRDVKPENVLVSENDVVKLCDFGFARFITVSQEPFTDYVATRWYRAPELLVGEPQYGRAVDIWALGALIVEMMTTEPLFAGDSDIDQLHKITKMIGNLTDKQMSQLSKGLNGSDIEMFRSAEDHLGTEENLQINFPFIKKKTLDIICACLKMDPMQRLRSDQLLVHSYFIWDNFPMKFLPELRSKIAAEEQNKPKIKKIPCPPPIKDYPPSPAASLTQKYDWKVEFHPQEPPSITHSDILNVVSLGGKSTSSLTSNTYDVRPFEHHYDGEEEELLNLPTPLSTRKRYASINNNKFNPKSNISEDRDEEKSSLLRHSKLMARYRREMMPQTLRIVPLNGRLVMDDPVRKDNFLKKPTAKDFCLPELPGNAKKRKQEPFITTGRGTREVQDVPVRQDKDQCLCSPLVMRTVSSCPLCNPWPKV